MLKSLSQNHLENIISNAYEWLKKSRKNHPASSDIWDFHRSWNEKKLTMKKAFLSGSYSFDVQKKIRLSNGETIALWSSRDSLILKVLTRLIQICLKPVLSKCCYHLEGHGGLKRAVTEVLRHYPENGFFCKTDVREYYDSIDHLTLMKKLHLSIRDRKVISYVWQFLNRTVEWGGLYREVKRGITRGSSLSPLLGAFYLIDLDKRLEKMDVRYFRYMDDVLILAKSRWKLKKAIRVLNQTFNELNLQKHPDKTDIGKTERGFDFLGYHFSRNGLSVSARTIENGVKKLHRLYEQKKTAPEGADILGEYLKRWQRWATAGLGQFKLSGLPALELAAAEAKTHQTTG